MLVGTAPPTPPKQLKNLGGEYGAKAKRRLAELLKFNSLSGSRKSSPTPSLNPNLRRRSWIELSSQFRSLAVRAIAPRAASVTTGDIVALMNQLADEPLGSEEGIFSVLSSIANRGNALAPQTNASRTTDLISLPIPRQPPARPWDLRSTGRRNSPEFGATSTSGALPTHPRALLEQERNLIQRRQHEARNR